MLSSVPDVVNAEDKHVAEVVEAAAAYEYARHELGRAKVSVSRDEQHWRDSVDHMREVEAKMREAREALLRATGAVLRPDLAQEV